MPFLIVLVAWLAIIFFGVGLFAKRRHNVPIALCVCGIELTALALDPLNFSSVHGPCASQMDQFSTRSPPLGDLTARLR